MNILYFAEPSSESPDSQWMKYFVRKPNKVYLICRRKFKNRIGYPKLVKEGIQIIGYISDFSMVRPFSTFRSFLFIKSAIRKYNIDVFHILYAEPNALWAFFKNYFNCKIGLSTRGSDILISLNKHSQLNNIQDYYVYPLYKKTFMKFDFVTCTSNNQKKIIEQITNGRCAPHIIRTGINYGSIVNYISNDTSSVIDDKYILFPRSMRPLYNHEFAIGSLKFLTRQIKSSYTFVFLDKNSRDKSYVEFIQKLLDEYDDLKYIFLDRLDQSALYSLYRNASLVVMTPRSDGSSVCAMEAMAFGIPVIMPPLDYDLDLFGDWVFKLKTWDKLKLAKLLSLVLSNDNKYKTNKAKRIVSEKGNREIEMKKLLQLYES